MQLVKKFAVGFTVLAILVTATPALAKTKYYYNQYHAKVPRPAPSPFLTPSGPSAICRDGTYSYSQSRRGTCSHHGGVSSWK